MRLFQRRGGTTSAAVLALAAIAGTLGLVLASACSTPADHFSHPGCNVILISIDTLRADRLGCYGFARETSPNIDSFRADGALFSRTIAQAPSTMASHASMFTSLLPSHHGALISGPSPLPDSCTTLAELLRAAGYGTISFNDGGQISAEFGFDQGFDRYVCLPNEKRDIYDFIDTVTMAGRWLSDGGQQPFFLFLHTYHTHHPYTPDRKYLDELGVTYSGRLPGQLTPQIHRDIHDGKIQLTSEDRDYFSSTYDAEIRQMDVAFGTLVERLKELGLYHEALIILTSDHGEELGEHGCWGWHSHTLFEELLRVPLIIKFPGNAFSGTVVEKQVRSLDILPTVLDTIDVAAPEIIEGRSLLPLLRGRTDEPRPALSQIDLPHVPVCLNFDGWKYYPAHAGYGGALYRIEDDPLEGQNLVYLNPETAREMRAMLEKLLAQRPEAAGTEVALPEKVTRQLKKLGYLEEP